MFFFNPLEQFEILPFFSRSITSSFSLTLLYTNLIEVTILNFSFFLFLALLTLFFAKWLPRTVLQYFFEGIVKAVTKLFIDNSHLGFQNFIPLVFLLTVILLVFNCSGMIPFTFTVTSHLFVTLALSFLFFFSINFIGIKKHRIKFLAIFLPQGSPLGIMPLIIIIELVSYIARLFSLAIRLFANILSGHTLLKILSSFLFAILYTGSLFFLLNLVPITIVLVVICLELFISALQAYVFVVLCLIYFKDVFDVAH